VQCSHDAQESHDACINNAQTCESGHEPFTTCHADDSAGERQMQEGAQQREETGREVSAST